MVEVKTEELLGPKTLGSIVRHLPKKGDCLMRYEVVSSYFPLGTLSFGGGVWMGRIIKFYFLVTTLSMETQDQKSSWKAAPFGRW